MPSINISASVVRQDISNNRSLVRLKMTLHEPSRINFSTSKSGKLQGQSFTYTSGASGSGTWTLRTRDIWVGHNSDGTKTYSYSGSFNIAITYSGSWISTLSDSGSITLPRIPRQSSLTSASMDANLKPNTANQINISISSQTNFGHWLDVYYGSTRITSYQSTGKPSSLALTASEVNNILSLAKSTSRPTLSVRMSTRDGSTQIGSTVTRSLTATIDSGVKPSISSHSTSIAGSGHDKTINKYVQGITQVAGSFNRSAGYGASIAESKITIEKTDGTNRQIISSDNGTTGTAISGNGDFRAIAYVRDSRGLTTTNTNYFTVEAYTQPKINGFTAVRPGESGTTVNVGYSGSWSNLGGSNKLTVNIERKQSDATNFTNVQSETLTSGSFSKTTNADSIREDKSYMFRISVRDDFYSEATSERTIGTAKTVFAINKNLGIGVGKRHERGEMDIAGDVYISNDGIFSMDLDNEKYITMKPGGDVAFGIGSDRRGNTTGAAFQVWHNGKITSMGEDVWTNNNVEMGTNGNGSWIRFPNGMQICWSEEETFDQNNGTWFAGYWYYPKKFSHRPYFNYVLGSTASEFDSNSDRDKVAYGGVSTDTNTTRARIVIRGDGGRFSGNYIISTGLIAIGRWK